MTRGTIFTALTAMAMAVAVPTASAQSPVPNTYGGQAGVVVQSTAPVVPQAGTTAAPQGATPVVPQTAPGGGVLDDGASGSDAPGVDAQGNPAAGAAPQAAQAASDSELPFTGFDALLLALGGAVLLALGFAGRRLSRQEQLA